MASISWSQALAWRMRQQLLDPVGTESVAGVVRRLGAVAVQSQLGTTADLAIRLRRQRSRPGDVARALGEGRIIETWAMRGAVHLMTPEDAGDFLALRASSRMWELPSWQSFYHLTPEDWQLLRVVTREALANGPLTREELATAITTHARFRHLRSAVDEHWVTLLKPLAWQGELSFGPSRDGLMTFQRLDANPRWAGLPGLDEAGPRAVESYVRGYGPVAIESIRYWLGAGLGVGLKRIQSWSAALGDRLATVEIDGEPVYVLRDHLRELAATRPTSVLRFLPGYDPWVLGPGTADRHVVPPARRSLVSRGASLVVVGGVVCGTWTIRTDHLAVAWFAEAGPPPDRALAGEATRLGEILDRPLELTVHTA